MFLLHVFGYVKHFVLQHALKSAMQIEFDLIPTLKFH